MSARKLAIDPLWQCLCPSWTSAIPLRSQRALKATRRAVQCLNTPPSIRPLTYAEKQRVNRNRPSPRDQQIQYIQNPLYNGPLPENLPPPQPLKQPSPYRIPFAREQPVRPEINYHEEPTPALYNHMRAAAANGDYKLSYFIAKTLVQDRGEKPSIQLYNTLIASNVDPRDGAAWRVRHILEDMEEDGFEPDANTCHAVLKAVSVHVDHLLRADVLQYMGQRWFRVSEDGAHDVAAGLFREGLFEQALQRLDMMRAEGMKLKQWLLDLSVYSLCLANEISEAHRIMRWRVDANEPRISRALWMYFLDRASEARHYAATSLAWNSEVNNNYINPSSGICLNVLTTAAQAADAVMATEVFTKLSERGSSFQPIHYEQLINAYLAADPPDLKRALSVLTIMALEKLEPSPSETRSIFTYLTANPDQISKAYNILRDLHEQGRKIPITALNVLIECYVEQRKLAEAMNVYKQIHTFVPISKGAKKTFANIETFNILLRGCNRAEPPDAHQASFLISELLALRITPTYITFDRLIIVFASASRFARDNISETADPEAKAAEEAKSTEFVNWAFRHFQDMQPLGWLPRVGTLRMLAMELASVGDDRCWDVLQVGDDNRARLEGWTYKGPGVRMEMQRQWNKFHGIEEVEVASEGVRGEMEVDREERSEAGAYLPFN